MIEDLDREQARRHCKGFRLDDGSAARFTTLAEAEAAASQREQAAGDGVPFRVLGYLTGDMGGWFRIAALDAARKATP